MEGITITDAWSRSTSPAARTAVVYLTLRNAAIGSDILVGAETPAAERVEIHRTTIDNGIARMAPVSMVEIPAGGEVRLEPNGLHMMLVGLRAPLSAGGMITLRLVFCGGRTRDVVVAIRSVRGGDPSP